MLFFEVGLWSKLSFWSLLIQTDNFHFVKFLSSDFWGSF